MISSTHLWRSCQLATDKPDTVYVSDITYIPTKEWWLYLIVFIDMFSRMVVGWSMSNRITANLVNDAFIMTMWKRKPKNSLMVHSDRGGQYASKNSKKLCLINLETAEEVFSTC